MKLTTLLLSFLFYFNALAAAPLGVSGQADTSNLYPPVVKVPNKQATKITGGVLLESGNKNILTNPSFEHETYSTGWSLTGTGTFSAETSTVIDGKKALKVTTSSQTFDIIQNSSLYAAQFADGVQCVASVRIKSTHTGTITVYVMKAGVAQTGLALTVTTNGKWNEPYKIPFTCGGTSNGIEISATSGTGDTYIEDAKVEPTDLGIFTLNATQSSVHNDVVNSGTVDLATSTITKGSGLYTLSGASITAVKRITVGISLSIGGTTTASASASGIRATISCSNNASSANRMTNMVSGIGGASSASLTTELLPGESCSVSGTPTNFTIQNKDVTIAAMEAGGQGYSSNNADTDWASCGHTTSDFTGFGTVTNIETQCKREGSDLLMRGKFTSGTSTATEARLALKLNGTSLTSSGTGKIPSLQLAGDAVRNTNSTTYFRNAILIEPSTTYVTFSQQDSTRNTITKVSDGSIGGTISLTARIPINGWENSNIIIGQFNGLESCADTLECTDTFSAYVSAAGVVSRENVDWINGNCVVASTNQFTCTYKSGIATVPMNCSVVVSDNTTVTSAANLFAGTSSTLTYQTWKGTDTVAIAQPVQVLCQKQGADYIGKTAKAVASDQNIRSVGAIGVDFQSVYFGSGASCGTACSSGTCTVCNQVGSKITSVTWVSTGVYRLNGIDGTKYNCSGTGVLAAYYPIYHDRNASTSTYAQIGVGTTTGANTAYATVNCVGIP